MRAGRTVYVDLPDSRWPGQHGGTPWGKVLMLLVLVGASLVGALWLLGIPVAQLLPSAVDRLDTAISPGEPAGVQRDEIKRSRITPLPATVESPSTVDVTTEVDRGMGSAGDAAEDAATETEPVPELQSMESMIPVADESHGEVVPITSADVTGSVATDPGGVPTIPATAEEKMPDQARGWRQVLPAPKMQDAPAAAQPEVTPAEERAVATEKAPLQAAAVVEPPATQEVAPRPMETAPPVAAVVPAPEPRPTAKPKAVEPRNTPKPERGSAEAEPARAPVVASRTTPAPKREPRDQAENNLLRQLEITDYLRQADRLYQQGDFTGAIKVLRRITAQYPDSEDAPHVERLIQDIKKSAGELVE